MRMAPLRTLILLTLALVTAPAALAQSCVPDPCQHGSLCAPIYGTTDYTCVGCDYSQWTGKNCDVPSTSSSTATSSSASSSSSSASAAATVTVSRTTAPLATKPTTTTPQPTSTGAGLGQFCRHGGNIIPINCAPGLVCNITSPPPALPDIASTGVCVYPPTTSATTPAPTTCICYQLVSYVCGTDGVTYINQCYADCKGVKVAHTGPCKAKGYGKAVSGITATVVATSSNGSALAVSSSSTSSTANSSVCTPDPCHHTSRCVGMYSSADYTCVGCDYSQWTGKNCDVPISTASSAPTTTAPAPAATTTSAPATTAPAATKPATTAPQPTSTGAGLGQFCRQGGNIIPINCAPGLVCNITSPPPALPDIASTGVCVYPPTTAAPLPGCAALFCRNNATCTVSRTSPSGYACTCKPGFYGPNCENGTTTATTCYTGVPKATPCDSPLVCVITTAGNKATSIPNQGTCQKFDPATMCELSDGSTYISGHHPLIPAGDTCNTCDCVAATSATGTARLVCTKRACPIPTSPPRSCPPNMPEVKCFADPCSVTSCPAYPGAICTANYCGGCFAIFSVNGQTVNCTQVDSTATCPPGVSTVPCTKNPCLTATCPSHPTATCIQNHCGLCTATFTVQGKEVNCQGTKAAATTTPAPTCICNKIFIEVCGKDGVTYTNQCYADCKGVKVAHTGPCSS